MWDWVSYKVNPHCFNTQRSFPVSFNLSNAGEFFWSYILEDCTCIARFKKRIRKSFQVLCLCPPQKVKLGSFISWLCHDNKEMYKYAGCTFITIVFLIHTSYHYFLSFSLLLFCLVLVQPLSSHLNKMSHTKSLSSVDSDNSEWNVILRFVPNIQQNFQEEVKKL